MCYTKYEILDYTRGAETVFDIIFTVNIVVSFMTSIETEPLEEIKEIKDVYKNAAVTYAKYLIESFKTFQETIYH